MGERGAGRAAVVIVAALAALAVSFVALSLRRPEPPTYAPTRAEPADVGARLVGPAIHTVDARRPDRWRFFDFSRGAVIPLPDARGWDLAFRRFDIIVNGGPAFAGDGGALAFRAAVLETLQRAPADGYAGTATDSTHPLLTDWYDYGFTTHLLMPKPRVYVIRTADGRYAKLRILSYYCAGALPGCVTFEYLYQGDGTRELSP